jgi:hypothetical protein
MADNEYIERSAAEEQIPAAEKKEKKKSNTAKPKGRPSAFAQILNGDFLTREFVSNNLNFIFFVIFLLLLIVGKGYYGKQLTRDVDEAQNHLNEVTSDYVEAKARLEEQTRRYRLVDKLESRGVKETQQETKVIRIRGTKK